NNHRRINEKAVLIMIHKVERESGRFKLCVNVCLRFAKIRIVGNNAQCMKISSSNRITRIVVIEIVGDHIQSSIKSVDIIYCGNKVLTKLGGIYFCTTYAEEKKHQDSCYRSFILAIEH